MGEEPVTPHVLVMTATPIPRTLAMTLYGDLDNSVIDEMPPGRKPVNTTHAYESRRLELFGFIRRKVKEGRQVYIVYPLIKESETLDLKNLMEGYDAVVREFPLPAYASQHCSRPDETAGKGIMKCSGLSKGKPRSWLPQRSLKWGLIFPMHP